jgi:hypothetical protein
LFERAGELANLDAVVGWEMEGTNQHDLPPGITRAMPATSRDDDHPMPAPPAFYVVPQ